MLCKRMYVLLRSLTPSVATAAIFGTVFVLVEAAPGACGVVFPENMVGSGDVPR